MDVRQIKSMITSALAGVRQGLRGRIQRAKAAKQVILVQVDGLAGERFNDAELFQQPGLRSVPLAGMQAIVIPLGGRSANGVVVAMSNGQAFVADLQPGEVAIFNEVDGEACSVVLRNGRIVDIQCDTLNITASTAVNVTTPTVTLATTTTTINATTAHVAADSVAIDAATTSISGNANVGQTLAAATDVTAAGKSLKGHKHTGVSLGLDKSGPPE